jgi:negative regulator of sigma E activity
MKKQTPHITDEHIVAYLDGELHVSPEFERELRADPVLHRAAAEYAVIGKALAMSTGDARFKLTASIDARAKKVLSGIAKSRKEVRTAAPSPNAAPVRSVPATRSIKYLWAKRTAIGLAFASLIALLLVNYTGKNELITQVPVPIMKSVPAPVAPAPAPEVIPSEVSPKVLVAANNGGAMPVPMKKNLVSQRNSISKDLAANATSPEAPRATHEQEKTDPADIMISHRYAKMIKSTPVVEVTQQDRMIEQDRM